MLGVEDLVQFWAPGKGSNSPIIGTIVMDVNNVIAVVSTAGG